MVYRDFICGLPGTDTPGVGVKEEKCLWPVKGVTFSQKTQNPRGVQVTPTHILFHFFLTNHIFSEKVIQHPSELAVYQMSLLLAGPRFTGLNFPNFPSFPECISLSSWKRQSPAGLLMLDENMSNHTRLMFEGFITQVTFKRSLISASMLFRYS